MPIARFSLVRSGRFFHIPSEQAYALRIRGMIMGYRITYLPKGTFKQMHTKSKRLPFLTGLFFLLFCLHTRQHNSEYITLFMQLLSDFAVLLRHLLESYLL